MSTHALAEAIVREVDVHDGREARRVLDTGLRIAVDLRIREFLRQTLRLSDSDMRLLHDEEESYHRDTGDARQKPGVESEALAELPPIAFREDTWTRRAAARRLDVKRLKS